MKVLIIQQKMIGDVLTTSVLCELIKTHLPEALIHYMVHSNTIPVIEKNPFIDKVIDFNEKHRKSKIALFRLITQLNKEHYDILIDVYGKLESNLISIFLKANRKIAYDKWYTRIIYSDPIKRKPPPPGIGQFTYHRLQLVLPLLENTDKVDLSILPKIYLSDKEKNTSRSFLKRKGISFDKPIFMISVLGSSPDKTYPAEYMAQLLNYIAERQPCTLLFNYIPSQVELANEIYNLCGQKAQNAIERNVFANSLRDFLSILFHCQSLIGNEGGAVNMAKAMDIPTFAIFAPWIEHSGWKAEDNSKHASTHLHDLMPHLFPKDRKLKTLKPQADLLYSKFKPELFLPQLEDHLIHLEGK